jgi:outer membrane receptor protein involved in Fe transport
MILFHRLNVLVFLFVLIGFAAGEETTTLDDSFFDEKEELTILDDLSIEANTEAQTKSRDSLNRTESVSLIEINDQKGSSKSLAKIINTASGIKVRQSGGLGSESKINIRGMEGKNIKVLINGIPIESQGNLTINDIPVDQIERVEVYKGYIPARFATDGMGGAVNIITKAIPQNQIDASYSISSFNTHRASLTASHTFPHVLSQGDLEIGAGGYYNYSDNDYEFTTPFMKTESGKDTSVIRDHGAYSSSNANLFVNLKNFWFDKISIGSQYNAQEKEIQGTNSRIAFAEQKNYGYGLTIGVEKRAFLNKNLSFAYLLMLNKSEAKVIDTSHVTYSGWTTSDTLNRAVGEMKIGIPSLLTTKSKEASHSLNLDYILFKGQTLNWNTLAKKISEDPEDDFGSEAAGFNTAGFPGSLYSLVSGISLENELWNSHIINLIGVKGYYYKSKASQAGSSSLFPPSILETEYHSFGYNENIQLKVADPLALKAGYQHNMRFPTHEEIFGNGIDIRSAPDLKPEAADNFNIGFQSDLKHLPLLQRLQVEGGWFYSYIEDKISRIKSSTHSVPYSNMAPITVRGYEADLKADVNEYLFLSTNLTWQDLRNKDYDPSRGIPANATVPNIPRFYMNFGTEIHLGDLLFEEDFIRFYWNANYTDEYYYAWKISSRQDRIIPVSFSQDIGIEYSICDNTLSWSFEVANFMDEEVYDNYGETKPGRTFSTKIRYSFK